MGDNMIRKSNIKSRLIFILTYVFYFATVIFLVYNLFGYAAVCMLAGMGMAMIYNICNPLLFDCCGGELTEDDIKELEKLIEELS